MATLYRPAFGTFTEAMKHVVEVDIETLPAVISEQIGSPVTLEQITVSYHLIDPRNGWLTHVVCVDGQAVGFTNAML